MNPGHPNQLVYGTLDAVSGLPTAPTSFSGLTGVANYRWDTSSLAWVRVSGGTTTGPDVNVTNFPASQTVNGSVSVSNFPATQAVSIASWTGLTDTQLRASAVPVSGTFFQATQPVSLATNTPDVTDRAGRLLGTIANTAFTANAGTNLNTSALALESGHLATIDTSTARIPVQGQALKAASLPVVIASDQATGNGGLAVDVVTPTPLTTKDDGDTFDDDGIRYVNPNVPGADIATGDKQSQIVAALNALLATPGALGVVQSIVSPITVGSVNSIPLAANAAVENAGTLQRIADTLELVLLELRVSSISIAQLQQPQSDGVEQIRNDLNTVLQ